MTSLEFAGAPGSLYAPVDWVALSALQERMKKRADAFGARCLDEAADRLMSGKAYKHTGEKLAKCLCRDCRSSTRLQQTQPDYLGSEANALAAEPDAMPSPGDLEWAAEHFTWFLSSLPAAARTAFAYEVQGAPRALILATAGVAERQYRELRKLCFFRFRANPGVMTALRVLRDAGDTGLERFKAAVVRAGTSSEVAA